MRAIHFEPGAYKDFVEWATMNPAVFKKIAILIQDIQRDFFKGLGKPEPLNKGLQGLWSRRINDEHRLVYKC